MISAHHFAILFALISVNCFSSSTISCSHISSCLLAKEVLIEKDVTYDLIISERGNPHDFQPNQTEIKKLLKAERLITPPVQLQPWLRNIIKKKDKIKIMSLGLPNKTKNVEALAHFWLSPQAICHNKKLLQKGLSQKWNLKTQENIDCSKELNLLKKLSELSIQFKNKRVILTHDALAPLLGQFIPDLLVLKSSHHGDAVSPSTLKKLVNFIANNNSSPLIWILEEQISLPSRIKKKIQEHDKIINIRTSLSNDSDLYSILSNLYNELAKL